MTLEPNTQMISKNKKCQQRVLTTRQWKRVFLFFDQAFLFCQDFFAVWSCLMNSNKEQQTQQDKKSETQKKTKQNNYGTEHHREVRR